jgi:hypothetical protein
MLRPSKSSIKRELARRARTTFRYAIERVGERTRHTLMTINAR